MVKGSCIAALFSVFVLCKTVTALALTEANLSFRSDWKLVSDPYGDYETVSIIRAVDLSYVNVTNSPKAYRCIVVFTSGGQYQSSWTNWLQPGQLEIKSIDASIYNDPFACSEIGRIVVQRQDVNGFVTTLLDKPNPQHRAYGMWGTNKRWNTAGTKVRINLGTEFCNPQNYPEDSEDFVLFTFKDHNDPMPWDPTGTYLDLDHPNVQILAREKDWCGTWVAAQGMVTFTANTLELVPSNGYRDAHLLMAPVNNLSGGLHYVNIGNLFISIDSFPPFNIWDPANENF